MEENNQMESEVLKELCIFYDDSKEWIEDYSDYAIKFNTEMVERKLSFSDLDGMLEDYTVLILTANSIEQNILTCKLYYEMNADVANKEKLREIYADGCVYQFATIRNINIVHMHPNSTSSFTVGGSANAVRSALDRFRPKLVISLGVAFGIDPKKQHLGDVLLSSAVIPYDIFNKDTDGDITLRSQDKFPTHEALNAWNVLIRTPDFFLEEQELERQSLIKKELCFRWQFGTMLSGGSVLSNENKKQALLRAARKYGEENIIGGEMEGTGVYFECRKPDIPCIVIKGICDWGAEKNSWNTAIQIINERQSEKGILQSNEYAISNDFIKDCVQAYAMDHATEALLRLLRFDSGFLDAYSSAPKRSVQNTYKWKQKFAQAKQFFILRKEKIFRIVGMYILLLLFFTIFNIYLNSENIVARREMRQLAYIIEIFALILLAVILAIKEAKELHPIEVHHIWANFNFDELDFEKNNAHITLNDHRPIFHVVISWWLSSGKISQGNQEIGNLKGNSSMNFRALNAFNHKTILQIDYELANGDHYVHLISRKRVEDGLLEDTGTIVYCERIFRVDGLRDSLIGIQNAVIKSVVPKMQESRD